ncbi:MAG TPA: penicillin-binding transpeptidase domain-containing protein, partial [Actinomycetota bacterium]|nr:penicillin-binding transpeptidase domain-containing protein [Actinomycetota bacterium]
YLNTVYFGQGAYGIEAAARTYFSEPASALSLTQGTMLAGLIASPSRFDPVYNAKAALSRRNLVLGRMRSLRMIDQPTYSKGTRAKLGLRVTEAVRFPAPYFIDYVKRWFLNNPMFGATFDARYNSLFEGGLRIYTTVDLSLQREAESAVSSILSYRSDPYGAMTVIDPRTGAIRAMVGGRDWFSRKDPYAKLNLATGGATGRQAGSAFKPFALVTALEEGIQPSRVYAAPSSIALALPAGYSPPVWDVHNYDGASSGALTIEQATIDSVNTVYAQLIMDIGSDNVVRTAHQMGITSHLRAYPSAVLGSNEVNTVEMASAYGTLATLGKRADPMAVSKITDAQGKVLYQAAPQPQQVIQPAVAWATNQILEKVVQEGTGTAANIGRPEGGKTGTAQQWTNAWFVGYIPQLVAAVWVGFPKGQIPMVAPATRLPHVLGGTWPAQIWHAFMVNATRNMAMQDFPFPDVEYVSVRVDITQSCVANQYTLPKDIRLVRYLSGTEPANICTVPAGPQEIPLPSVVGLPERAAVSTLRSYGFPVTVLIQRSDAAPRGIVVSESPAAGTMQLQGTPITVIVARGPPGPSPSPSADPTPSPSPS